MKDRLTDELVAMRVAKELLPGNYCNLGIGIPLLCAAYIPDGVIIQSENGVLGYGPVYDATMIGQIDPDIVDAGMRYLQHVPGIIFLRYPDLICDDKGKSFSERTRRSPGF